MNPFLARKPVLSDEYKAAWASYEAASKAAAESYEALPVAYFHAASAPCIRCSTPTRTRSGVCAKCKRKEREEA